MTISWYLNDFFMILLSDWWYFYDTSCKIIQNVSFFYLIICQLFIFTFSQKNDTLRLFHKKTFFVRAHTQRYIQKVSDIKSYRYKKIHHDVNFNAKKIRIIPYFLLVFSILLTEVSHVVQVRAEGPKAPSPGHRPGYNGNQQGALFYSNWASFERIF